MEEWLLTEDLGDILWDWLKEGFEQFLAEGWIFRFVILLYSTNEFLFKGHLINWEVIVHGGES